MSQPKHQTNLKTLYSTPRQKSSFGYLERRKRLISTFLSKFNSVFTPLDEENPQKKVAKTVLKKLTNCSSHGIIYRQKNTPPRFLHQKCRHKLCSICQTSRQYRISSNLSKFIEENITTSHQLHFLTITTKNTSNLKSACEALAKGWSRLIRRRDFPYSGYIKALEITIDKNGLYHPHYHIILVRKKNTDNSTWNLKTQWIPKLRQTMKLSYDPVVDIRNINFSLEDFHNISSEVAKTTSYSVKSSTIFFTKKTNDFSNSKIANLISKFLFHTYRKRAISVGGSFFKGLKLTCNTSSNIVPNPSISQITQENSTAYIYNHTLGSYAVSAFSLVLPIISRIFPNSTYAEVLIVAFFSPQVQKSAPITQEIYPRAPPEFLFT